MATREDRWTVSASPTKDFFISILVRDIALADAINDLVDNCVDGARRLKPRGNYKGLEVRIEFSPDHFLIADNCGGIPVDNARLHAFKFGRDKSTPQVKGAIGQFGVGMKRTLFKMGNRIEIQSMTEDSFFEVDLNVETWKEDPEWDFKFAELKENQDNEGENCGTRIKVTELNDGIGTELTLAAFDQKLRTLVQTAHSQSLDAGLAIVIQGKALIGPQAMLKQAANLKAAVREKTLLKESGSPVATRLYVGIAESNPNEAGWYVSCNGRLILHGDQTSITGWGEGKGATIPKYHNQFARFRGYVFMDSKDGNNLPWNTTKTGVDPEHPVYQSTRLEMISLMRPIIDFLNKLDAEKDAEKRPLTELVNAASPVRLELLWRSNTFEYSVKAAKQDKPEERIRFIQYGKPDKLIRQVQKSLGVSTLGQVGEKTFDYYYNAECK